MYDPFRIDWSSPAVAAALAARGLRIPAAGAATIGPQAAEGRLSPTPRAVPQLRSQGLPSVPPRGGRADQPGPAPRRGPKLDTPVEPWLPASPAPDPWQSGGMRGNPDEVRALARNAFRMYKIHLARGWSPAESAAWAANIEDESGGDYRITERLDQPRSDGRIGRGLFQTTLPSRVENFRREMGVPIEKSTEEQQLDFRDWELARDRDFQNVRQRMAEARTAGNMAGVITRRYELPDHTDRRAIDRANIANEILALHQDALRPRRRRR